MKKELIYILVIIWLIGSILSVTTITPFSIHLDIEKCSGINNQDNNYYEAKADCYDAIYRQDWFVAKQWIVASILFPILFGAVMALISMAIYIAKDCMGGY